MEEANKYFPKLRRLEEIKKFKSLGKSEKFFKWIGSRNQNACGICSSHEGKIFSYNNPPDCGFPPAHPNCNCSIVEVTKDDLIKTFAKEKVE